MRPHSNNTRSLRAIKTVSRALSLTPFSIRKQSGGRSGAFKNKRAANSRASGAALLLATACAWSVAIPARAGRQPGAPRLLRFSWSDPLARRDAATRHALNAPASVSQPAFGVALQGAPSEIFFTRTSKGTSNLWRAVLEDDRDSVASTRSLTNGASSDSTRPLDRESDEVARRLSTRGQVLRARPLTRFKAPFFASDATPTPDGHAVLCVTNALGLSGGENRGQVDPARRRIARLDLESGQLTAVSAFGYNSYAPAIAPDGTRMAFVSDRLGPEQVFVAFMDGGDAQRVESGIATRQAARRPFWLDNETLVLESTRRANTSLYRIALPQHIIDRAPNDAGEENATSAFDANRRQPGAALLWKRGGQGARAPNGRQLCVATATGDDFPNGNNRPASGDDSGARLYFLAGDGSTVRTVPSTEGARNPVFSPDGSALLYDAPLASSGDSSSAANDEDISPDASEALEANRGLWLLPMVRVAPTARLLAVRAVASRSSSAPIATEEIEIVGTAFASGDDAPQVQLQWGEGDEPSRWNNLPLRRVPAQAATLATWRPPAKSSGPWMLRLTVTDSDGDKAESFLPVSRPLPSPLPSKTETPAAISIAAPAPSTTPASPATTSNVATAPNASIAARPSNATLSNPLPRRSRAAASTTNKSGRTRNRERLPIVASSQAAARTVAALPPPTLPPPALPASEAGAEATPNNDSGAGARPRDSARSQNRTDDAEPRPSDEMNDASPDDVSLPPFPVPSSGGPLPTPVRPKTDLPRGDSATHQATQNASDATRDDEHEPDPRNGSRGRDAVDEGAAKPDEASSATKASRAKSSDASRGARLVVTGAPRETTPGREMALIARLSNRGRNTWESESERPVRLLVRWQDVATRRRARWEIKWLRDDVRPGQTVSLPFSISAPPRPGTYTLSVSLLRLNGSTYQPPPADSRARDNAKNNASTSPAELANVVFSIVVR